MRSPVPPTPALVHTEVEPVAAFTLTGNREEPSAVTAMGRPSRSPTATAATHPVQVLSVEPRTCYGASFENDDGCGCGVCVERATILAGCPHRLERVVTAETRNDRLYDGLCDECFEQAREVRDCGLRVAEHDGDASER